MKLRLEINSKPINDPTRKLVPAGVLICPPVSESFWLLRVKLSEKQAIVGFPKFGVIGVGFQHENDWNTNLPSGCKAEEIYDHIKHNKGDRKITKTICLEAIRLIQDEVYEIHLREYIDLAKEVPSFDYRGKLELAGNFLRRTGAHNLAQALGE